MARSYDAVVICICVETLLNLTFKCSTTSVFVTRDRLEVELYNQLGSVPEMVALIVLPIWLGDGQIQRPDDRPAQEDVEALPNQQPVQSLCLVWCSACSSRRRGVVVVPQCAAIICVAVASDAAFEAVDVISVAGDDAEVGMT